MGRLDDGDVMPEAPKARIAALDDALVVCDALVAALQAELTRGRQLGSALACLDGEGILRFVSERTTFIDDVGRLQNELGAQLAKAGRQLGLAEVTLATLSTKAPEQAEALARGFSITRELSHELKLHEQVHRQLLEKGLALVNGYLSALRPAGSSYDRRGSTSSQGTPVASTFSRRV
jgi:hypothetical protein